MYKNAPCLYPVYMITGEMEPFLQEALALLLKVLQKWWHYYKKKPGVKLTLSHQFLYTVTSWVGILV